MRIVKINKAIEQDKFHPAVKRLKKRITGVRRDKFVKGISQDAKDVYSHIALSLARGCTDLYYVEMESGDYIEFHTDDESGVLTEARRGKNLFESCKQEAQTGVYEPDREEFLGKLNRPYLKKVFETEPVCDIVYRRLKGDSQEPFYVQMKVSRIEGDKNHLVLAVSNIDEQVRQRQAEEKMIEERIVYARLHALTGNFVVVYVVDPITDEYREFSSTAMYETDFAQAKEGTDFFSTVRKAAKQFNYPEDIELFLNAFTKENVLNEVERSGIFTLSYRFMMKGKPIHVQLKAAMVEEKEGLRLIVGLNDVNVQVQQEEENARRLTEAQAQANIDALTGVKNKHAYLEAETLIDRKIKERRQEPFAVTICDINDLKHVNDTEGHQAGDEYIKSACSTICTIFDHSPVFRVGGDEFAIISQGRDFERIEELIWHINEHNSQASETGGAIIACGMSKFASDNCVAEVFERADHDMYDNKNTLKAIASEVIAVMSSNAEEQDEEGNNRYDYLTGLLTISAFLERASEIKETLVDKEKEPVLLYMDLAGMAFINAKHGFTEGDKILKEFALLLVRLFGRENCCRIGSDHFAAVTDVSGLEHRIKHMFKKFYKAGELKAPPVRVGIYSNSIEDVDASTACDRAKLACNSLKGTYESAFAYYDSTLQQDLMMRQYIVENFKDALEHKYIEVYLQPIIRSVNERVCDVEALARWNDPKKGLLVPVEFIPALEDANLVCQLDLYMVERVLEAINTQLEDGFTLVPHSINLSRLDFDSCDIVEEIRKRVEAAGVDPRWISIEITESVIGHNFEFMKEQVKRFQSLGFQVWLDDFGSGYSSLDILQSIKFDLLKLDMSFMQKFEESEDSKIVLTELIRMASSLGLDTLCEGVETEEQVRFLQEIGCSKMQGYYFRKPIPFEETRKKHTEGTLIENENPDEVAYFENIGKVNLYDLGVIAQEDQNSVQNAFNTLPMGIIEIREDSTRWLRSNQSYRDFIKRFFGFELSRLGTDFVKFDDVGFLKSVVEGCSNGERVFYDERMPDGSVVHSFARFIDRDPVTNTIAIVVAVLSINEPTDDTSYAEIARALAADYKNIYVVDLEQDTYIAYSSLVGQEDLAFERHGDDIFTAAKSDALTHIDSRDQQRFLSSFSKENVLKEIEEQGTYTVTYRLIDSGKPTYVHMKASKLLSGNKLIIGVSTIDSQMRQQEEAERLKQERAALGRIAALAENYVVLYTIDYKTGHYIQYNPSHDFAKLGLATEGDNFFRDVIQDAPKAIPEKDIPKHLSIMAEDNVKKTLESTGVFVYEYNMTVDDNIVPSKLKATLIEDEDGKKIILGVTTSELDKDI